jgi:hypothetical protein
MAGDWLQNWFGESRAAKVSESSEPPQISWLGPADNPWGVPVLDLRPMTLGMLSTSRDQQCAANALSFARDDGTGFIGVEPRVARRIAVGLHFRIDKVLADGALFLPGEMEHKWALYFHRGQIIFIRSWWRRVEAVADTRLTQNSLQIRTLRGAFLSEDEEPQFSVRVLDFLIRSHALDMVYPAPLPPGEETDLSRAALCCMSCFGSRARFATPHVLLKGTPEQPLRTYSLLHIAVARGDEARARRFLEAGVPPDLLGRDGLAPLHWALARNDNAMLGLLLESDRASRDGREGDCSLAPRACGITARRRSGAHPHLPGCFTRRSCDC